MADTIQTTPITPVASAAPAVTPAKPTLYELFARGAPKPKVRASANSGVAQTVEQGAAKPPDGDATSSPATTAKPETKPEDEPLSKQYAILAREKKRIAEEAAAVEVSKTASNDRLKKLERYEALEKQLAEDPLGALKEWGLDYAKLYAAQELKAKEDADPTLRKVRELETKLERQDRERKEADVAAATAKRDAAKVGHLSTLAKFVSDQGEKYEFIKNVPTGVQDVYDRIEGDYKANSHKPGFQEMEIGKACDLVEADYESAANSLLKLHKVQAKLKPAPTQPAKESQVPNLSIPAPRAAKAPALSGSVVSGPITKQSLSFKELREQAFARLTQ